MTINSIIILHDDRIKGGCKPIQKCIYVGDCILVHSTQAKFYHELRTGQTNNNDLTRYSGSVPNGERKFPGQRDSNLGDPYLGNTDNGAFVGRESKLDVHFVPRKRVSLDEGSEERGR